MSAPAPTTPPAHRAIALAIALLAIAASSRSSGATFVDVTDEAEVSYLQWHPPQETFRQSPQVMTGGAAVADYDGDGWPDLFVTRYRETDILFRNLGDGTFDNVSTEAGFDLIAPTNGASWGDIDNDGDPDLYLSVVDETADPLRYLLYINNGDGTFTEEATARGAALETPNWQSGFSTCFGDYDRDGKLDIHTCQWSVIDERNRSVLLKNSGTLGHFAEATASAGVEMWSNPETGVPDITTQAFTSHLSDIDRDGWPDLVVAGDFGTSRLFWNSGDGTFVDGTAAAAIGGDENGMGLAVGDYDGDGLFDLFFTSIFDARGPEVPFAGWGVTGNRLYRNLGGRTFADDTDLAGVRDGGWGWGTVFFDYDNDGDLDLAMANGFNSERTEAETPFHTDPTKLWRNDGGTFVEVASDEGISEADAGKGLLVFDFDRDGDLDLFTVNCASTPTLHRNDLDNGNHWLRIKTRGQYSNRDGIGTLVSVTSSGIEQTREISGGSNYLSQSEKIAHFGLGPSSAVVDLTLRWPSGIEQRLSSVAIDQALEVTEPSSPYEAWLAEHFTEQQRLLGAITTPAADPDSDTLSNALEFGCGLDPRSAGDPSPVTVRPDPIGAETIVTFRRRNVPRGVQVTLQRSDRLTGWESVPASPIAVIQHDDWGVETVTVRVPAEGDTQFRLRVTIPD